MIYAPAKTVRGGKKATIEATAVVDPESGKLMVCREEIKKVSLQYCLDTLKDTFKKVVQKFQKNCCISCRANDKHIEL